VTRVAVVGAAVLGLHPDRATTIAAGVVILVRVLEIYGLDNVEVPDRAILWGAALDSIKRA
jgi:exopolyphosphatase/pppGpp-phosphohydrolase